MIPPKFREYARAFYEVAKRDGERARRAMELRDFLALSPSLLATS